MEGQRDAAERAGRAREAWAALMAASLRTTRSGPAVHEPGHRKPVHLWPLSQVLHAAGLLDALGLAPGAVGTCDPYRQLARHARTTRGMPGGEAWTAAPGGREVFYDDHAWVGLAALEMARTDPRHVALARRMCGVVRAGAVDLGDDGVGVRWQVGGPALHACSTAPGGLLAARLAPWAADAAEREELERFARRTRRFVQRRLLRDDGLVADHVRADGTLEPSVWAYNQGSAIALDTELGDPAGAARLAVASLEHFGADDGWWRQPPVFAVILLRELLALDAHDPDPRWRAAAEGYAERVWREGRDPRTGLVGGAGGIGRYDRLWVLDHAGATQLWALLAGPQDGVARAGAAQPDHE